MKPSAILLFPLLAAAQPAPPREAVAIPNGAAGEAEINTATTSDKNTPSSKPTSDPQTLAGQWPPPPSPDQEQFLQQFFPHGQEDHSQPWGPEAFPTIAAGSLMEDTCIEDDEESHKIDFYFAMQCVRELDERGKRGEMCLGGTAAAQEPVVLCRGQTRDLTDAVWARWTAGAQEEKSGISCTALAGALQRGMDHCCAGEDWATCRFASRTTAVGATDLQVWAYALEGRAAAEPGEL